METVSYVLFGIGLVLIIGIVVIIRILKSISEQLGLNLSSVEKLGQNLLYLDPLVNLADTLKWAAFFDLTRKVHSDKNDKIYDVDIGDLISLKVQYDRLSDISETYRKTVSNHGRSASIESDFLDQFDFVHDCINKEFDERKNK